MNTWIAAKDDWTLNELKDRSALLSSLAQTIWPMPQTEYRPAEKQLDSYSLEDDINLSGRDIARFVLKNTEQPVNSWVDMFERVIRMLHSEDKSILAKLAFSNDAENELDQYVSCSPQSLRSPLQVDTDIFVERNTSTNSKISMLRKFFRTFDVSPDDLVFFLRDADEVNIIDEPGSRYELRRRYWAYALDFIHAAHFDGGIYQNVNPTRENWISGFIGISGVSVNCVANYDCARVELYLGNASRAKNKALFDLLLSHKNEIEASLSGAAIEWSRNDDAKSSSIFCRLDDVNISNEADWPLMAKFHAEWSRKFYDVMAPYLRA